MVGLRFRNTATEAAEHGERGEARTAPHRYVVLANRTLGSAELSAFLEERGRVQGASFHLVVPADRVCDPDEALAASEHLPHFDGETCGFAMARYRLQQALARLGDLGLEVSGEIADPDELEALTEVLAVRPVDEIVVSTLPARASRWHAHGLIRHLRRTCGVAVTHVEARSMPADHVVTVPPRSA
jgi:hypothetical protein